MNQLVALSNWLQSSQAYKSTANFFAGYAWYVLANSGGHRNSKVQLYLTRALLAGATLDHFRVYSLILNLDFSRSPMVGELPADIWLSASGQAIFLEASAVAPCDMSAAGDSDFFEGRKQILEQLYSLIGKKIMAVDIDPSGTLQLRFETGSLLFGGDQTDLEEIWSTTSDAPEPYGKHDWSVTLTDRGELVTHRP